MIPKDSIDVVKILGYMYLSPNRGFLFYQRSSLSKYSGRPITPPLIEGACYSHPLYRERASIISIDIDKGIYDFVGDFYDEPDWGETQQHCGSRYHFCPINHNIF